jgi:hypothetical protein
MKQLSKPTLEQRKLIQSKRLNPENWMVERDTPKEMVLVHKHFNNNTRTIKKENAL